MALSQPSVAATVCFTAVELFLSVFVATATVDLQVRVNLYYKKQMN
jgi:hypothetical protein